MTHIGHTTYQWPLALALAVGASIIIFVACAITFWYKCVLMIRRAPRILHMLSEEEAELLTKLLAITKRIWSEEQQCAMPNAKPTPLAEWKRQIGPAIAAATRSPAGDGRRQPYAERWHMSRQLAHRLLPTLRADLEACVQIEAVLAMETQIAFDTDGDGDIDENDIAAAPVDLLPIYQLERSVKAAATLLETARFVPDAQQLLERRRVERDIIEGIQELNANSLRAALATLDARRDTYPISIGPALEAPARRLLRHLEVEDQLEDAVEERATAHLLASIEEAQALGAVSMDLLRPRFEITFLEAHATTQKLRAFDACERAMSARDAVALDTAIVGAQVGWWRLEHWCEADRQQLRRYQLGYKRLTAVAKLRQALEPSPRQTAVDVGLLQAALDTALQVKIVDPLVDQAVEILSHIDREKAAGEFRRPYEAGGAYGSHREEWLDNPHFRVSFKGGDASPSKVRLCITCSQGREGSGYLADTFGAFALHVVRDIKRAKRQPQAREVMPGFELVASTEYKAETAVLTIDGLDTSHNCFIVPSTLVQGEEGAFIITVLCETPYADLTLEPVVQVGSLMLAAMEADDLIELQRLLDMARHQGLTRVHEAKAVSYLARRRIETRLTSVCDEWPEQGSESMREQELKAALEGSVAAHVSPSLIERAQALLACLSATEELRAADASGEWQRLDEAIRSARAANVPEATLVPHLKRMRERRAAVRLSACLAKGEDGYTALQATYEDALSVGLIGSDVQEARRLIALLADAQRFLQGQFEDWMGGGYPSEAEDWVALETGAEVGQGLMHGWLDNPQYRLQVGDVSILRFVVSVDRAGDAAYDQYAVHVVRCSARHGGDALPGGRAAPPPPLQVGSAHEVVACTAYLKDADHEGSTASCTFEAEANATYFIVPSTSAPHPVGGYSVTTVGMGSYTLEPVPLLQSALRDALASQAVEALPALIRRGESSAVGMATHPLVLRARAISEMEIGWQRRSAEMLGRAITRAKAAEVDPPTVRLYAKRYRQLAIEEKLVRGMAGDTALLHAACEEARIIAYDGPRLKQAEKSLSKKFTRRVRFGALFDERNAKGARRFGSWRENPTWRLTVTKKCTVYVAVNEDGVLSAEAQDKLKQRVHKEVERHGEAHEKMVAAQAAAAAEPKDFELAGAAREAVRTYKEQGLRRAAAAKTAARVILGQHSAARDGGPGPFSDGGGDTFPQLGVHIVRNSKRSWVPGVLSGYEDLSLPAGAKPLGDDVYGDGQAYCAVEIEPTGPVFIVPSTWWPGEEMLFTLSLMSAGEFSLEEVEEFDGTVLKLGGEWSSSSQGPRSKTADSKAELEKSFKPEKTWRANPQFRVWLRDPESNQPVTGPVTLSITLSTPIEVAELGLHVVRNAFCQFQNESVEVLTDRYQRVAGICPHCLANELTYELTIDQEFEVKKNGCESKFPFFIVPSLMDKRMEGAFQLTVYSDKAVTVQQLDDADRKV